MKALIPLPLAALALAGCTTTMNDAAPGSAYRALCTEPGWSLIIAEGELRYDGDYGETKITVPAPEARPSFNGHRYVTPRLTVDITHSQCSDGMSDRLYADTVTVNADGRAVSGCGGAILDTGEEPQDMAQGGLEGTSWVFVSIDGTPVTEGRPATLAFDEGRLSGSAGCNRFSGAFTLDGRTLAPGPIGATKMACMGAAGEQEARFLAMMAGPVSWRFDASRRLVLEGNGHEAVFDVIT